jgi:2-amino-4-hydroxy-6-hydroxymethyldihydropteridine diphosphokinase
VIGETLYQTGEASGVVAPAAVEAGLSLGSNLGDRLATLRDARRRFDAVPGLRVTASSPLYETEPVGVREEHRALTFLNAVLIVACALPPEALSAHVHRIEDELGRRRGADRYAPRPIDIDILYIGGAILRDDALTVPHPQWTTRRFVVQPLADVRPDLVLPGQNAACRDILAALPALPGVQLFSRDW